MNFGVITLEVIWYFIIAQLDIVGVTLLRTMTAYQFIQWAMKAYNVLVIDKVSNSILNDQAGQIYYVGISCICVCIYVSFDLGLKQLCSYYFLTVLTLDQIIYKILEYAFKFIALLYVTTWGKSKFILPQLIAILNHYAYSLPPLASVAYINCSAFPVCFLKKLTM